MRIGDYFLSSFYLCGIFASQTLIATNLDRPNIIYIMSDDHASQAVSAYGGILSNILPTPNIDRIAHEGAILRNCFVTQLVIAGDVRVEAFPGVGGLWGESGQFFL